MSGPRRPSEADRAPVPPRDTATAVIRWAAFSCLLVPLVLLYYGASLAGAAGPALGLAAVTAVCRVLLRRSERGAARPLPEERAPRRGGRHRVGTDGRGGGRHGSGRTPVS